MRHINTERLFVVDLKFLLQGTRLLGTQAQILCALWLTENQVLLQASVSSSVKWDSDRKVIQKAGPSSSKTRPWEASGICTPTPALALPATATRGQQHLVVEGPLWLCDPVSHQVTQSANADRADGDDRAAEIGVWPGSEADPRQPHQGIQGFEEGAPGSLFPNQAASSKTLPQLPQVKPISRPPLLPHSRGTAGGSLKPVFLLPPGGWE